MRYLWEKDEGNQFFKHVPHISYSTRAPGPLYLTIYHKSRTFSRNNGPRSPRGITDMWHMLEKLIPCKKIYVGETGRRLADRFREHLRDAEQNNTDASK